MRIVITEHEKGDNSYLSILDDFIVKELKDSPCADFCYIGETISKGSLVFKHFKNIMKQEGIGFYSRYERSFVLNNKNRFCFGSLRGNWILRGRSSNYFVFENFNKCSLRICNEILDSNLPVWGSRLGVTIIISLDKSVPYNDRIKDLIKHYGCSHS